MTERMGRFIVAYLECGNAKEAALVAGYSASYARSRAYKLLEHPSVVRALESGYVPDEWAPCRVTDERAKEILSAIVLATPEVFFDARGNFDVEHGGVFRHAIREFTITEDASSRPVVKVKFWDKLRALRELRRWHEGGETGKLKLETGGAPEGGEVAGGGRGGTDFTTENTPLSGISETESTEKGEGNGCQVSGARIGSEVAVGEMGDRMLNHEGHDEKTDSAGHDATDNLTDTGVGSELGSGDADGEKVGRHGVGDVSEEEVTEATDNLTDTGVGSELGSGGADGKKVGRHGVGDVSEEEVTEVTDNLTDTGVGSELGSGGAGGKKVGREEVLETSRGRLRLAAEDEALLDGGQLDEAQAKRAGVRALFREEGGPRPQTGG